MLPVVDYGGIAVVVPKIAAIGSVFNEEDKFGFEVFLAGMEEPLIITFSSEEESNEAREDLIAIVAQYHYIKELGPDFDIEELSKFFGEEDDENGDTH